MTHGSLFSGIGGFDLAAEWMGWENLFHCDWNLFGQKVLKHYWPNAESFTDITKTDFTPYANKIDILTGGFPCQPYSLAGKRKGKEDERHLWPEMLRAIREVRPRWVVGENVFGLVNWSGGMVFHEVQADLEAEGYEVQPYVLPACAVNAPHRRDRVWFVAHARSDVHEGGLGHRGHQQKEAGSEGQDQQQAGWNENGQRLWAEPGTSSKDAAYNATYSCGSSLETNNLMRKPEGEKYASRAISESIASDTDSQQCEGRLHTGEPAHSTEAGAGMDDRPTGLSHDGDAAYADCTELQGSQQHGSPGKAWAAETESRQPCRPVPSTWEKFPTEPPVRGRNDGIPTGLAGTPFSASQWRNESIKAYGNAIVPQVAYEIFKAIEQYEQLTA